MAAFQNMPLPRIPRALANHQENLPLKPYNQKKAKQVLGQVISLKGMCAKWWLEKVQYLVQRGVNKSKLFSLQRFLCELPRELRSYIIHNGLKAGGLHLYNGSKEIPAVNKALVFLSSEILVRETIYLTLTKSEYTSKYDFDLLTAGGEGVSKIVVCLPKDFNDDSKVMLNDLFRTCRNLTHVTVNEANDKALIVVSRYGNNLQYIDVSRSEGVTDEGVRIAISNLKYGQGDPTRIRHFDVNKTSVTDDGIVDILLQLPSLKSMGQTNVIDALEQINQMTYENNFVSQLEEVNLKCVTVNRVKALKKYCPNLHTLKAAFLESDRAILNDLRILPNLKKVDIIVREPFILTPANLHDFAWTAGAGLERLCVSGDVFWDVDLGILAAQCPHVQCLSLPSATFLTNESLLALSAKGTLTLTYLRELEIDCTLGVGQKSWAKDYNLARRGLVLSLTRCKYLKRIVLRPTNLVDNDLFEILSENRLEYLETLEFYNSMLGLEGAKLLVDTCINLHIIRGIRTWRGMTLHDLVSLRQYGRGHNRLADLKILWF